MDAKKSQRHTPRSGFTLVELLVVIVIISMLAGMATVGIVKAIAAAKRATICMETQQIVIALEQYKNECGEYPPDCFSIDLETIAADQNTILRHFRKRFPRYQPGAYTTKKLGGTIANSVSNWGRLRLDIYNASSGANTSTAKTNPSSLKNETALKNGLDINTLTPSSALLLFLGGIPDYTNGGELLGFSANPNIPVDPSGSRAPSFFELDVTRIKFLPSCCLIGTATEYQQAKVFKYVPKHITAPANSSQAVPYVYFRAHAGGYGADPSNIPFATLSGDSGSCLPYARSVDATGCKIDWYKPKSFQIIAAGLDGEFGAATYKDGAGNPAEASLPLNNNNANADDGWKMARYFNANGSNLTPAEDDNLSSFTTGRLEDGVQ